MFNVLMIGDIFGRIGRKTVEKVLPEIVFDEKINFIIANGENVTNGRGLNWKHYNFLKAQGIDVITGGNHSFDNPEIFEIFNENDDVLRPANYNRYVLGIGTNVYVRNGVKIRVTNILGKAFIIANTNSFYEKMDDILKSIKDDENIHIVDFHGEATAEKIAFMENYKGKVSAILGTHTHVQTADERIKNNTAYITDVGATCAYNSVIGSSINEIIYKEKIGLWTKFTTADEEVGQFCAVVVCFDDKFIPKSIRRIYLKNINLK